MPQTPPEYAPHAFDPEEPKEHQLIYHSQEFVPQKYSGPVPVPVQVPVAVSPSAHALPAGSCTYPGSRSYPGSLPTTQILFPYLGYGKIRSTCAHPAAPHTLPPAGPLYAYVPRLLLDLVIKT
ncbi:Serine/threonine protein kinase [Fusarium falciforme]